MSGSRKIQWKFLVLALLLGGGAGVEPARAQFTGNNQTNIISAVTSNWPGDYYVGSNTFANALLIRSAGVLTNADAHLGYLAASSNNYALVSGAGSVWSNANLYLGNAGAGNVLVVSNAGRAENVQAAYVANTSSSSSNRVLVTGTNSVLNTASTLFIGYLGGGNTLVVSNAGRVANATGYVGDANTSSGNSALITGTNSAWTNYSTCTVGYQGSNNKLVVNKGGRLYSAYATIGLWDMAMSNTIVVSDSGTLWDNSAEASDINFGMMGSGNSLIVTNGGKVLGYYAYFGRNGGSAYNSALVTDPGSSFSVNCYIYTGNQGHDNSFTAANGAAISDKFCYISYATGSSNNSVLVTGTNTTWQSSFSTFVGMDGVAGNLTISTGAVMNVGGAFGVSHDGALGVNAGSGKNRALVAGGGALWNITDNMYVGLNGPANSLVLSNGGKIICTEGYVGSNPGSDNNSALVAGAGSVWTNRTDIYVGHFGWGNSLVISNGGRVYSGDGYIARSSSSGSNSVVVTGSGSLWTNSATVFVGYSGVGNSLVISNNARITDDWGMVGYNTNSINNQALVTGPGSVWSNRTAMFVGDYGSGNTLVIRDGAVVTDYWGLVGEEDSASNNTVRVESGGVWVNQQLAIGDLGSRNALFVDGGTVSAGYMVVGYDPLYCNNLAELDSGTITVTNSTHDAVLEVYGGGFLLAGGTLRVDTLLVTNSCAQFMKIGGTLICKNLVLNPDADADGDGIPNAWEQARGLDPLNPLDAAADNDGDGMSNLQEYLAGTNPTNSASCFRITSVVRTNKDIRVNWKAVGGKHYVVQRSTTPFAGYTDLSPMFTIPGSAEMVTNYVHVGGATNWPACFYRVRLAP